MSRGFFCDDCVRRQGLVPKSPPDSGNHSWLCCNCGHFNIGSKEQYTDEDWLRKEVIREQG